MSECTKLAEQIQRAYEGEAWHGDSLRKILRGVTARQAAAHPIKGAHSIWELVLHIAVWDEAVIKRASGKIDRVPAKQNFPLVKDKSEAAWQAALEKLESTHERLVETVAAFPDARLEEMVPGKKQSFHTYYYNFAGVVQHKLYHAGQIALLKKA